MSTKPKSTKPKEVTVEEFCDFMNDDAAWHKNSAGTTDYYFDDFDEDYHAAIVNYSDGNSFPVKPGSMVNLKRADATIGWQGKGTIPPDMPDSLVDMFFEWREKRDFVYIAVKAPRAMDAAVRQALAAIEGVQVTP